MIAGRGAGTLAVVLAARARGAPRCEADPGSRRRWARIRPGHRDLRISLACTRARPWWTRARTPDGRGARPRSSSGPDRSGGHAPGTWRPSRSAAVQAVARWLPGEPTPSTGITLSDAGGPGERARTRRSARPGGRRGRSFQACGNGCSVVSAASSREIDERPLGRHDETAFADDIIIIRRAGRLTGIGAETSPIWPASYWRWGSQAAAMPRSSRWAIQTLMTDWRVTPRRRASDSIIHCGNRR